VRPLHVGGRAFRDRADAGRALAGRLGSYVGRDDVFVLGLPRGGVPVAAEVAVALDAPLDVVLVRKLGVPGHPELAMGALGPGGVRVLNTPVVRSLGITTAVLDEVTAREQAELDRRQRLYRGQRPPPELEGKVVIVVDDGLATGATMRAAVSALRVTGPARIVVAVPVGAQPTCRELAAEADEVVCVRAPATFQAVGQWYDDFSQTTDEEIHRLLSPGPRPPGRPGGAAAAGGSMAARSDGGGPDGT